MACSPGELMAGKLIPGELIPKELWEENQPDLSAHEQQQLKKALASTLNWLKANEFPFRVDCESIKVRDVIKSELITAGYVVQDANYACTITIDRQPRTNKKLKIACMDKTNTPPPYDSK